MKLLFIGTFEDKAYLQRLKPLVAGATSCALLLQAPSTLAEIDSYCKKNGITGVITTSPAVLSKLLAHKADLGRKQPSVSNYAGSIFTRPNELEILILDPLAQLITVPYGKFLAARYISKFISPESWSLPTEFNWKLLTPAITEEVYARFSKALFIVVDIETRKIDLSISCIGYTAVFETSTGELTSESIVLPVDSMYAVAWMRKFNALSPAKVLQNGKYDCSYLFRYSAPLHNYLWDTANLFHCWYSELPKDLAQLGSFFIRNSMYWKDMAETQDLMEYYHYNALDTWTTANVFIQQMLQMPEYAKQNYLIEFPVVFPCHMSEMRGIKRDMEVLKKAAAEFTSKITTASKSLEVMTATPGLNTNSHVQVKQLLAVLGCADIAAKSSDEAHLKKAIFRHPLNSRILNKILDVRGHRKLVSTYLVEGKEHRGRILYALNPHATDTGRLASREHHFWCGLQIQNIPRGKEVKQTLVADEDFLFMECDLEQAESRDTAHISGDPALIAAVSGDKDFHSVNASAFFGRSYDSIYCQETKKTKDKALRDLAKRVNHGANYNMGPAVLVDTMGEEKIWEAKRLLGLKGIMTAVQVAEFLLSRFHATYAGISKVYYPAVIAEIKRTSKLVGATGWTRYCFGDPTKSKSILNAYVAHPPQSLNAMVLNKAFLSVFYNIALHSEHSKNFKLIAQIHDSILFQVRKGHEYLGDLVRQYMEIPVPVTGCDGVTRTFTVPAALKAGPEGKGAKYWSDTE